MTTLTDNRIEELIQWHKDQVYVHFGSYVNSDSSFKSQSHQKVADYHRDTAEALAELAEFRREEEMAEEEYG